MSDSKQPNNTHKRIELTFRAILTGTCLGGALSLCNVYMGLKMAGHEYVSYALLSYGGYRP